MKRFIAFICMAALLVSVTGAFPVTAGAAESLTSIDAPETILGAGYSSMTVVDLSGSNYTLTQGNGTASVTNGLLDLKCDNAWSQATIAPGSGTVSATGYEGLLFYADCSDTVGSKVYVSCRIKENWDDAWTRDTYNTKINHDIVAYYQSSGGWVDTHITYSDDSHSTVVTGNGERFELPAQYEGWIYVPFSSYVSKSSSDDKTIVRGLRSEIVKSLMILTGGYETGEASMRFGDFRFVCLDKSIPSTVIGMSVVSSQEIDLTSATVSYTEETAGTSFTDANGLHLVVNPGSGNPQCDIVLSKTYDMSGYTGIMFYMDGVNCRPGEESTWTASSAVGLRLSAQSGGGQPYFWNRDNAGGTVAGIDIVAYNQDGDGWSELSPMASNNERFAVNGRYAGWVYIPFSSYAINANSTFTAFDPEDVELQRIMLLLQNYGGSGQSQRFFNLRYVNLVKLEDQATVTALPEITASISDAAGDDKIDHLYLNAAISASETRQVGIIFSDSEASCEAGAKPLFIRVAEEGHGKSANGFIQSGCYGSNIIRAEYLGGEEGDSVIAVYWQEMPTNIGTLYARTFAKNSDGTYDYGAIATIVLKDGVSVLPIE
ncbi:MAG: hypothetical protein IJU75_03050 [Clostridia bacterium]|nr:hypothetical protein [Clostridia bacterium]